MSKGRKGKGGGSKRFPNRRRASSRHATPSTAPILGRVQLRSDGSGVLQPLESKVGPVYLPPEELSGVGPGDQVRIITSVGRKGKLKGKIIERLEERPVVSVGVVERMGRRNLVAVPMLGGGPVMLDNPPEARDVVGLAVRVKVTENQTSSRMAVGEVTEILGDPQDPKVQLAIAVIGQGLPTEFPDAVLEEVEAFPEPNETCEEGRRDLRKTMQVTIDGADARDFDDAVGCVEEGGCYRIWVSIADVSHYVRTGTRLDAEAYQRGTSVYFPHSVLPMLPERLSNDLCSLRPNVIRYAMTMEAVVGKDGVPKDIDIYPSLIQSRARLTYEDAQSFLDSPEATHEADGVAEMVRKLGTVSGWIRSERMERGAVDLDLPESKVVMDDEGRPKDVALRPRLAAHRLIEDLMIAANEAVARFLEDKHIGGLYRIHESPTAEKLERLKSFLKPVGIRLDVKSVNEPGVLSDIVSKLQETERGAAVQQLVLQSMQQAKYSPNNVGHFGLGSSHYLHFTSPIRRYPDLIVHRALKAYWAKEPGLQDLDTAASWTSARERAAMDAERDIVALASCHVAKERIGESFQAVVVGVHPAGAFVRPVGFAVDGLVPRESIEDAWEDEVDFDEKRMQLQGYRTRQGITLGDELSVDLIGVDIMLRRIQFAMTDAVEKIHREIGGGGRGRKPDELLRRARDRFGDGERDSSHRRGGRGKPPGKRPGSRPGQRDRDGDFRRRDRSEGRDGDFVAATAAKAVMVISAVATVVMAVMVILVAATAAKAVMVISVVATVVMAVMVISVAATAAKAVMVISVVATVVMAVMVISVAATAAKAVMVISVAATAAKAVNFRRRDRSDDGDFRRRDRSEGRDGDFRRRDRGEGRDGDFRRRDRGDGRDGDFRRRDRSEGRDGDFRRRDRSEGRDGDFRRRDRGEGRDGDFRRRDRGEGRDGESRGGNGGYDRPKSPEVVGRDVKSLIQRVVGAEVVTSLARVRNQDRKSAELLDPLAFAVAIVLKLQDSVENAESLFECPGFNKRLLVMGVQRHVHR